MSEVSVLRKHLINYAKTKDVFAAYKASGYNREFYEAHRDTLALRSAAKKAFDAYKKENGSDKKLPRISELNAEYAMLLQRKKSAYAEYRTNSAQPEAACAGALGVQLAGDAWYFGVLHKKPVIGDGKRPVEAEDIRRASRLMYTASAAALAAGTAAAVFLAVL